MKKLKQRIQDPVKHVMMELFQEKQSGETVKG